MNQNNAYSNARGFNPEPLGSGGRSAMPWDQFENPPQPHANTQRVVNPPPQMRSPSQSTPLFPRDDEQDENIDVTAERVGYDPTLPFYAQRHTLSTPARAEMEDDDVLEEDTGPLIQREDQKAHASSAFPFVLADKPFMQMPQTNLIVDPVCKYLSIDSRDRDRTIYPNTNHFRVPLEVSNNTPSTGTRYRNIYSVTLLSCVVPNVPQIFTQPYILLQIDEVSGLYDAANPTSAKAFTKLYFREVTGSSAFLRSDKAVGDPSCKIFYPAPRASLDHVTVSFRYYDGTLVDFGADTTAPTDPNTLVQTTFTLEIKTMVVDVPDTIGHRNI